MNAGQRAQCSLPLSVREQPSDGRPKGDRKEKHCQEFSIQWGLFCVLRLLPKHDKVRLVQRVTSPIRCLIDA